MSLAKKHPDWDISFIAKQIEGRKKAREKIPSWSTNSDILFPVRLSMEQCSSEITAKYKSKLVNGEEMIDLTGGFGVDSFFIAQSFKKGIHVEINSELQAITKHNLKILNSNLESVNKDGLKLLKSTKKRFDLIYLDPSRRNLNNRKTIKLEDYHPNILENIELLFNKGRNILIKTSPLLDIKKVLSQINHIQEIHVIALNNECKEVLYLINQQANENAQVNCIDLIKNEKFSFSFKEENKICPIDQPKKYLYEPNKSILKAGAFNSIGNRFKLNKLNKNSHLYTSNRQIKNFPGRKFEIQTICSLNKKIILNYIKNGKANITKRNFPITISDIRKKTGLKEGGEHYLFATRIHDEKPKILICNKI